MKQQNPFSSFTPGNEVELDEPAFGFHPLQAFEAQYEMNGTTHKASIQGFIDDSLPPPNNCCYRVSYPDGSEKTIIYTLGIGFSERLPSIC